MKTWKRINKSDRKRHYRLVSERIFAISLAEKMHEAYYGTMRIFFHDPKKHKIKTL